MSVVGIDLGTVNSVIAVARNRGVDVVSIRYNYLFIHTLYADTRSRLQMKSPTAQHRKHHARPTNLCTANAPPDR